VNCYVLTGTLNCTYSVTDYFLESTAGKMQVQEIRKTFGLTFSKLLRKILGRFLILEESWEKTEQSNNFELGNNNAVINNNCN